MLKDSKNGFVFINNNENDIKTLLDEIQKDVNLSHVKIVSAFFNYKGFIKEFFENSIKNKIKIELITGSNQIHLNPAEAKILFEEYNKNKSIFSLSRFAESSNNPQLHSKFYLFYEKGNSKPKYFLFGSSNMTPSGFSSNYESNLLGTNKEILQILENEFNKIPKTTFDPTIYSEKSKIRFEEIESGIAKLPAKPYDYQDKIIKIIVKKLGKLDKGNMILPCGTGKTLISLWIKEAFKAKKVIVFLPSLSLLSQTLSEWNTHRRNNYEILCVCSDTSVGMSLSTDETSGTTKSLKKIVDTSKITIDSTVIKNFVNNTKEFVIFSTYHSSKKIIDAVGKKKFDFIFYDESHNIAQAKDVNQSQEFMTKSHHVNSKKKLFMTATPKILNPELVGLPNLRIYSMDDPKIFGETLYNMSFREAIDNPKIPVVNYKMLLIDQTEEGKSQKLNELDIAQTALLKVFAAKNTKSKQKINIQRIISYHSKIPKAKEFIDTKTNFEKIKKKILKNEILYTSHINGSMKSSIRHDILENFRKSENGLVTNVRCLTEGIDVPQIDGVFFSDPKSSIIDIIQAVGRALRRDNNKPDKIGYIIIPVYHGTGGYSSLINVLNALKHVDEPLKQLINNIDTANRNNTSTQKDLDKLSSGYLEFLPATLTNKKIKNIQESIKIEITDSLLGPNQRLSVSNGTEKGFWKRLSNNDVSVKRKKSGKSASSGGQMQIVRAFEKLLPKFDKLDDYTYEKFEDIFFVDENGVKEEVKQVRFLDYWPKPGHKRTNKEFRFTFKNKNFLFRKNAEENDIITFEKNSDVNHPYVIKLIKKNSSEIKKYPFSSRREFGYL